MCLSICTFNHWANSHPIQCNYNTARFACMHTLWPRMSPLLGIRGAYVCHWWACLAMPKQKSRSEVFRVSIWQKERREDSFSQSDIFISDKVVQNSVSLYGEQTDDGKTQPIISPLAYRHRVINDQWIKLYRSSRLSYIGAPGDDMLSPMAFS